MIWTEVRFVATNFTEVPTENAVAKPDVIGGQDTFEGVLGTAAVAVAEDRVALEGHGAILVDNLPSQ